MSAAIGIFTRAFAVGDGLGQNALKPLPVREEGGYGLGKGRAAGHRVQLADWAYLLEAAEQRATWLSMPGGQDTVRHDYYPHNHVYRVYDAGGGEIYNTEVYRDYPSYAAWSAVYNLGVTRTWMRPDIAPASADGYWYLEGGGNDRADYEYQFVTPYGSQPTARLRRVDDVRCLFYDLQHCTRRSLINGSRIYYYQGAPSGNAGPGCSSVGPWSPGDWPAHATRSDADAMWVASTSLATILSLHHEVVAHQDFSVAPAYAVVQLRATQQHDGPVVRNWGRYVVTTWTLDTATATASVDLTACGCDAPGLAAWMDATIGGYVSGDLYTGTARVVDLVYDLAIPADRMFYGWTWTPPSS